MKAIKIILAGIILILSSLFFMGICIINAQKGGPQGWTLFLFVAGVIVSIIRLETVEQLGDYEVIAIQTISQNGLLLGNTEVEDIKLVTSLDDVAELKSFQ